MDKGFRGRPAAALAGGLGLLCLAAVAASPPGPVGEAPREPVSCQSVQREGRPPEQFPLNPTWWEIRLQVEAKGRYVVSGAGEPLTGEYSCRALWLGRLEPDEDDFLLVHLRTEILEWRLREEAGPAGRATEIEAPRRPAPVLRVHYVLRDGRDVEFFFELGGITMPLHEAPLAFPLELPRSSGRKPREGGQAYGDFVRRGTSQVVLPESDFARPGPPRRFSWDWRRERQLFAQGRPVTVTQDHTAETVVTVIVH